LRSKRRLRARGLDEQAAASPWRTGSVTAGNDAAASHDARSARARAALPGGASRLKRIAALDLARFERPSVPGNRGPIWRAAWYVTNAVLFQSALIALVPSEIKAAVLRVFGARVGRGFVCKPRVTIKYPWFLDLGDDVWLGEMVWIDNHCAVRIGSNVCISQGAYLFTGNHDWKDPAFAFFSREITVGDGVWITAFQRIGPGTTVPPGHAVVECRGAA
jgi:putative colanic acid biosynthesis acetyltransferase WcaF